MAETLRKLPPASIERFGVPRKGLYPDRSTDAMELNTPAVIKLMSSIQEQHGIKMPKHGPEIRTVNQMAFWVDCFRGASAGARPGQ
jgi:hypothetical protein